MAVDLDTLTLTDCQLLITTSLSTLHLDQDNLERFYSWIDVHDEVSFVMASKRTTYDGMLWSEKYWLFTFPSPDDKLVFALTWPELIRILK